MRLELIDPINIISLKLFDISFRNSFLRRIVVLTLSLISLDAHRGVARLILKGINQFQTDG